MKDIFVYILFIIIAFSWMELHHQFVAIVEPILACWLGGWMLAHGHTDMDTDHASHKNGCLA